MAKESEESEELEKIKKSIARKAFCLVRDSVNEALDIDQLWNQGLNEMLIENGWLEIIVKNDVRLTEILKRTLTYNKEEKLWRVTKISWNY